MRRGHVSTPRRGKRVGFRAARILDHLEVELGHWAVRNRWTIIPITVVLVLPVAAGMSRLTFNDDLRVFFSESNPQLQALEALENIYSKDENVLFIVAPRDGGVFTRDTLGLIEELTAAAWKLPHATRVDSITNFQHTRAEGDDLLVEDLVEDALGLPDADLGRLRATALAEPLLVDRLVSPAGHVSAVNVNMLVPDASKEAIPAIAAAARELASTLRVRHPDTDIYIDGGLMLDNAFAEAGRRDMMVLAPIMLAVLILITGLALHSPAGTVATLTVIVLATLFAMGMAGWLGIELTTASVAAPTIILTLAVADSVHVLSTVLGHMQQGSSKAGAIVEALRLNFEAVFLTSVTTAIGFLSMNLSDAPPFRDLGNIVAIGVIAAFLLSVSLLPALIAVLPMAPRARSCEPACPPCHRMAGFVIDHCRVLFWGALGVLIALGAGIFRVELNDDWIAYFDEGIEVRQAADFLEANLTGAHVIEYSLEANGPGGINEPAYLAKVEEFARWYRTQPKVVHVNAITETMKRLNRNMHGDDDAYYRLPAQRDMAAQYLLLYEMSLPFGLDLNNKINIDKSATRMTVLLKQVTTREVRDMDERARAWLAANAPANMLTYGTGLSIIWAHLSARNIRNMLVASFGALVLISGLLIVALRSWRLGLLSLIPNIAPAVMAFGLWGYLVGQVGLGLSVIVSMTLGIVVDDTVHFLSKYVRARREQGLDAAEAVRHAFYTVGTAMWITTVALVVGFLVLLFSDYRMSAQMGLMSAITIALALAMDFLFLPALLIRFGKTGSDDAPSRAEVPSSTKPAVLRSADRIHHTSR